MTDGIRHRVRTPPMAPKPTISAPSTEQVNAEDARKRLRSARMAADLTPEALASLIGRASSTVRAHENGQNKITADMADAYGAALGVSPAWLLWGAGSPTDAPVVPRDGRSAVHPRPVEIVGEIYDQVREKGFRGGGTVYIAAPDYDDFPLQAFKISTANQRFSRGDYVVIAPLGVGIRDGDLVVSMTTTEHGYYNSLHTVVWTTAGVYLRAMSAQAGDLRVAEIPEGVVSRVFPKGETKVLGVVVAYGGQERPTNGRFVSPERLIGVIFTR